MNIGQIALAVALFCNILIMVFIMSRLIHRMTFLETRIAMLISAISIVRADIRHPEYRDMITGEDE